MDKIRKNIDIFFLLLIILIFFTVTFVLDEAEILFSSYLLLGFSFFVIVIGYYTSTVIGLLASAFLVFGYGSFIIYESVMKNRALEYSFWWLILIPMFSFIAGRLGDNTKEIIDIATDYERKLDDLITVDEITGLDNINEYIKELEQEMKRASRHGFNLVLMIIEVQYYRNLLAIYGRAQTNKIMSIMSNIIEKDTRIEDKRYKILENRFAIIMPNTSIAGAAKVKTRLKEDLKEVVLHGKNKADKLVFSVKVGIAKYETSIESTFEFTDIAERELEFDV
ncbi:diguanylate cyclase domain-containing protein [Abyssisolibacter fermentans]|uniref:diguanylate cyclase domain-containing protein n=1 Tax=Abyssisolibacter fermentans TaxID=1766203 RepID=UPI000830510F|nr:diguanylate cyclase [Abyssisolibacter fermentans]